MNLDSCTLCGRPMPGEVQANFEGINCVMSCPQCGRYIIDIPTAMVAKIGWKPEKKAALSCAARQASEAGELLQIASDTVEELAHAHLHTRVSDNTEKLLLQVAKRAPRPNQGAPFSLKNDFTLIDCFGKEEFEWYVERLGAEGLAFTTGAGTNSVHLTLSMKGWNQIQPLPRPGGIPGRCFVAMWFSEELRAAYEQGIKPAVKKATGKEPLRIDQKEHNNEITDEIMAEIRNAQFIVADFTGHRAGVYYEAGFAMGLGRPVIWSCREDQLSGLHFDTNHKNHIVWQSPEDLQEKLYRRIRMTILE
jgi:Nucleoside 2-deoxyribosyltransferase